MAKKAKILKVGKNFKDVIKTIVQDQNITKNAKLDKVSKPKEKPPTVSKKAKKKQGKKRNIGE